MGYFECGETGTANHVTSIAEYRLGSNSSGSSSSNGSSSTCLFAFSFLFFSFLFFSFQPSQAIRFFSCILYFYFFDIAFPSFSSVSFPYSYGFPTSQRDDI